MIRAPVSKITLDGQSVNIVPVSGGLLLNNVSHVNTNNGDIICNNGVVHPIDTVLIPPQLPSENIAQILLRDDARFKDLFLTLFIAELEPVLLSGDWTLFAPVDAAFAVYKDNLLDPTSPNALKIYQGGVMVNTANVIDADILATNGVIHAIDKVLIPPDINQIAQGKK
ncbi:POSTN-like protein [Mya arenaria]|uniref:POSTN-like protein n=1 Tax=Mya arenaria TaxID=6604 RepID=A0ABY7DSZ9_MYAAR|nr:POSTN-like protein [Mya arenaria]